MNVVVVKKDPSEPLAIYVYANKQYLMHEFWPIAWAKLNYFRIDLPNNISFTKRFGIKTVECFWIDFEIMEVIE